MSKKQQKTQPHRFGFVILMVVLAALMVWIMTSSLISPESGRTGPSVDPTASAQTAAQPTVPQTTAPALPLELEGGLTVLDAGSYSGIFMEDGSNEVVSGVFMIQVRNSTDQDLQYGEILLAEGEQTYSFQVTNLPSGGEAVLLEQGRSAPPAAMPTQVWSRNLAWFSDPMSVREEEFRITGARGVLNVTNISSRDIDGDIYVYYKYVSDDLYFGGITFRVRIEGGLDADEIRQIPSGHYDPESCVILDVRYHES